MKPAGYILIAVTVSVAAVFILYQKSHHHLPESEKQIQKARTKELFLGKRQAHSVARVEDKVFAGCEELETTLNDLDFRRPPSEWATTLELRELDNCEDPALEQILTGATTACFGKKVNHNQCVQQLMVLRSMLRTRFAVDANDPENVADLIIREFSNKKDPDFKKISQMSEKLLDMNPTNLNFQKLWAMSKLMANVKNVPDGLADEIYRRLDPDMMEDPDFQAYRMFLETKMDPMLAEDFSRDFVEMYPQRSQAYEMLGWSLWQQGRKDEAREQARLALKFNPQDPWLLKLNKDLNSKNSNRGSYQGRLQIGIQLEDLYN